MATGRKLSSDHGLPRQSAEDELAALAARLGSFRERLLHRRGELLRHTEQERTDMNEQLTKNQGVVNDVGDASVVDMNMDYFLALADQDRRELLEINDALARMQRGDFGICQSCENPIALERLEKLPHARLCIDCQATSESRGRAARLHLAPKL